MTRPFLLLAVLVLCSTVVTPQIKVPSWARDAVWYQIFPERFRNGDPANDPTPEEVRVSPERSWQVSPWTSDWYRLQPWESARGGGFSQNVFDRRYGGDLIGVIEKLDYLKDLGVTALYFNPVFEGMSLHKYDASSYHHIDNNFGNDRDGDRIAIERETDDPATWTWTAADRTFLRLIREAHARNIRIVIDGVFNHSGTDFWAFKDIVQHQQRSRYADWFDVRRWDDPSTPGNEFDHKGWWDHKSLPEFREDSTGFVPAVRRYFFNITKRWMDPNGDGNPSDGIDGWRLDVANEVSSLFWKEWRAQVKSINPEAIIIGEIWDNAARWLGGDQFDAVMNYRFAYATVDFFIDRDLDAAAFDRELAAVRADYAPEVNEVLQNLIDSHDTDRLASMIKNPGRRFDNQNGPRNNPAYDASRPSEEHRRLQRLIRLFQMTYVGAPMVYYGSEVGMWGADDPDDRKPMVWDDLAYEPEATRFDGQSQTPDPVVFDRELHAWYRTVIRLRNELEPLRRGSIATLAADGDVYAFRRSAGSRDVVVVLNRGADTRLTLPLRGTWKDVITGETLTASDAGLIVPTAAISGRVLVAPPESRR
jgi:cyclomaltodextrinase